MSRLGGDISLRKKRCGGSVADRVSVEPPRWMEHYSRLVILVHGYNNSFCAGCRSYEHFLKGVPERFPKIGRLFWPGDITPAFLSGASYSWKIGTAKECAERLADFLERLARRRSVPVEVDFVAHSLGCRLILEALDASSKKAHWPHVRVICLMAAAVPVALTGPGARLGRASSGVPHRLILHSRNDSILKWAFPIGQALAAAPPISTEEEVYLHAVGLKGEPAEYPTESAQMEGNGHSDYWSDSRIFRHICPLMGLAVERTVEPRWLPEHDEPAPVAPILRRTPERRIGPAWHSECETCF